jgi:hypothetical protein
MARLLTVGPPPQPGNLPAAPQANRVPNEAALLISERVRQQAHVQVDPDVFVALPRLWTNYVLLQSII